MKKFYIIEDLADSCRGRTSRSRIMYYVGYAFGLLQKFAIGAIVGAALCLAAQFLFGFIVGLFG